MADTSTERVRRLRLHRKGDHSRCLPERCNAAGNAETPVAPSVAHAAETADFGARGARLWREMNGDKLAGGPRVLLEEACRTADRLDRFNALESGDLEALLRFRLSDDGAEVTVTVDGVVAEARQQALALKQIIAELRNNATPAGRKRGAAVSAGGAGVPAGVVDLTARARERRAQAQG